MSSLSAWGSEWLIMFVWIALIVISLWRDNRFLKISTFIMGIFYGLMMLGQVAWFGVVIIVTSLGMLYYAIFD